jgi:hypothetical protein
MLLVDCLSLPVLRDIVDPTLAKDAEETHVVPAQAGTQP